jgi:hypothetical protein
MIIVRLVPLILSTLLIAAHFMRFYGLEAAVAGLLLLGTLFVRHQWILRFWQGVLAVAAIIWIDTTYGIVQFRQELNQPWLRLMIIMSAVIAFTVFSGFWLENKRIKAFYQHR